MASELRHWLAVLGTRGKRWGDKSVPCCAPQHRNQHDRLLMGKRLRCYLCISIALVCLTSSRGGSPRLGSLDGQDFRISL